MVALSCGGWARVLPSVPWPAQDGARASAGRASGDRRRPARSPSRAARGARARLAVPLPATEPVVTPAPQPPPDRAELAPQGVVRSFPAGGASPVGGRLVLDVPLAASVCASLEGEVVFGNGEREQGFDQEHQDVARSARHACDRSAALRPSHARCHARAERQARDTQRDVVRERERTCRETEIDRAERMHRRSGRRRSLGTHRRRGRRRRGGLPSLRGSRARRGHRRRLSRGGCRIGAALTSGRRGSARPRLRRLTALRRPARRRSCVSSESTHV